MSPLPLPAAIPAWKTRPKQIMDHLRNYYGQDIAPLPELTQRTALLCAFGYTILYILPFYLSPTLRAHSQHSRDSPSVIRARIHAVTLTSLLSTTLTIYLLTTYGHATFTSTLHLLGLSPVDLPATLRVQALTAVLFTCSLYEKLLVNRAYRSWSLSALYHDLWLSWPGYRNLVVAPISEELVFRALILPLFLLARTPPARIVLLTPLIFGAAHLHHLAEFLAARTPPGKWSPSLNVCLLGLARSLVQFGYTSLFGMFAAFVFLRTGSLWAVVLTHGFCNWMEVPRVWGRVGQEDDEEEEGEGEGGNWGGEAVKKITPDVAQGKKEDAKSVGGGQQAAGTTRRRSGGKGIAWTVVYYALMPAGAYAFYRLLWPWTESANALVKL